MTQSPNSSQSKTPRAWISLALALTVAIVLTALPAFAQATNTFPSTGDAGVGTVSPAHLLEIQGSGSTNPLWVETTTTGTPSTLFNVASFEAATTGSTMSDGFGPLLLLQEAASASGNGPQPLAQIGAIRNGADNSGNLLFYTSNAGTQTERMRILTNGNVGIGTTSPVSALQVTGANSSTPSSNGVHIGVESGYASVELAGTSGTGSFVDFTTANSDFLGRILYDNSSNTMGFYFNISGASYERMIITQGGNVGIANTSPSYLLHVGSSAASGIVAELQNSSGACTHNPGASSETVSCSSDKTLKTDIEDTRGALASVNDIHVRDFTVKSTGERRTGVIAQELMKTHPTMVHKDAKGLYSVDEPNPWVLVKAIQDLQGIVTAQQNQIEELKTLTGQLKAANTPHGSQ
jgi:hypothetical protein